MQRWGVARFAARPLDWISPTVVQARFWFGYWAFYSYSLTEIVVFLNLHFLEKKKPNFFGKKK